jgi:hypothetical protein
VSKTNVLENDLLKLLFNGTPIPNLADNAASSPVTSLHLSMHTADPGEAGDQTTNEAAYAGYARIPVARSTGGFTVTGNSVSPAANVDFPEATAGTGTLTHFGIGTALSGAGKLLYKGPITPTINLAAGVAPRLTPATAVTEE